MCAIHFSPSQIATTEQTARLSYCINFLSTGSIWNSFMSLAAFPTHQHINILNFSLVRLLIWVRRVTSIVLKKVSMGMGAFIYNSNA